MLPLHRLDCFRSGFGIVTYPLLVTEVVAIADLAVIPDKNTQNLRSVSQCNQAERVRISGP